MFGLTPGVSLWVANIFFSTCSISLGSTTLNLTTQLASIFLVFLKDQFFGGNLMFL